MTSSDFDGKNFTMRALLCFLTGTLFLSVTNNLPAAEPLQYDDPAPQKYVLTARASELDSRTREYPAIDFVFGPDEKPKDTEKAVVDTRVEPRGKLVIWLMSYNSRLFDRLADYGLHAIQVHYANRWFSKVCQENPVGENCRGNMRLEAATGDDYTDIVDIQKPDGMQERAFQFVKWLAKENPQAKWDYYINESGDGLRWDDVIMAGASHGSTTSARFALHQKVSRVVMLCGPRDQFQNWQMLPSATPRNRFFGFSHTLDGGWTGDHYCRSWELLGLNEFGPIVDVDAVPAPFENSRRLITSFDVGGNANKAHSSVIPGGNSYRDKDGNFMHEEVWRYLFTHPVDEVGEPVPQDDSCDKNQRD
ncbi:BPSS1187 family protein [Calycomorphotria hydatis]|uniref:Alpha/beta hydrolase family protein n=1 Tax=Calycomorphotria hydatis TaxID=2528027 RepID=A0A517TEX1_9PLAN|nr:hypothetical protein [Calycomorphotria hydatis]QDT66909.1 hypothetical protein V22_41810 [Calycomorphotria hydatis]